MSNELWKNFIQNQFVVWIHYEKLSVLQLLSAVEFQINIEIIVFDPKNEYSVKFSKLYLLQDKT